MQYSGKSEAVLEDNKLVIKLPNGETVVVDSFRFKNKLVEIKDIVDYLLIEHFNISN